jgi:hypothetical protein
MRSLQLKLCLAFFLQRSKDNISYGWEVVSTTHSLHFARRRSVTLEVVPETAIILGK